LVIVSPHWEQRRPDPRPEMVKLAHEIIDLGADAILGHGWHEFQGLEIYKGRPIVYSMGDFIFDHTRGDRAKSAVFSLQFDRGGFKAISILPMRLTNGGVQRAKGSVLKDINQKILEKSSALNPNISFIKNDDRMTVELMPDKRSERPITSPDKIHKSGSTRRLPDSYRGGSEAILESRPEWAKGYEPIELEGGIEVLGARNSEAARPRSAFRADVVIRVGGPLKGSWRAITLGKRRDGDEYFLHRHPFADGAWPVTLWKEGQLLVDRTLVRPEPVPPGVYDLYWGMENISTRERIKPTDPRIRVHEGLVPVGMIQVLEKEVPWGPAGLSWNGMLPPGIERASPLPRYADQALDRKGEATKKKPTASARILIVSLAALFVLAAALILFVKRNRG
jgi:hypothetical protein